MQIFEIQEPDALQGKKHKVAIGIDFGTTNSLIAYSKDNQPYVINDELIPSIIGESLEIGTGHIRSIKRIIGKSLSEILVAPEVSEGIKKNVIEENGAIKLKIGERYFSVPQAIGLILDFLKTKAEEHLGQEVNSAVITVPAHFDDTMRNVVKHASHIAGLDVLRLISEPTAAAYAYGLEQGSEGLYAVYDLGGGTFDISLLKMQMGVFQVLATDGDVGLGGDDIDYAIAQHLKSTIEIAKEAKEHLSNHDNWKTLSRSEFEKIITPIITRTIDITKAVIEPYKRQLKGIILVGGSTRIPLITKLLSDFGAEILNNVDPDKVVALGAALQADNLTSGGKNLLIDVVPLSMGMELMGGIMEKVILRSSPIPISATKEFTTYADNQTEIQINIAQGEREMIKDCRSLGALRLKNIPPMKAGMARVEVTFSIDADGILSVSAMEKVTGTHQYAEMRPTYGISEKDVARAIEDSYINASADHNERLITESIIDAQREIADLVAALEETPQLLDKDEYNTIRSAVDSLQAAIDAKSRDEILENQKLMKVCTENFIERRLNFIIEEALLGKRV